MSIGRGCATSSRGSKGVARTELNASAGRSSPFGECAAALNWSGRLTNPSRSAFRAPRFREAFGKIPRMRSRFTVIDIAFRCGWMEEWLDRLFGKGRRLGGRKPARSGEPRRRGPVPGA